MNTATEQGRKGNAAMGSAGHQAVALGTARFYKYSHVQLFLNFVRLYKFDDGDGDGGIICSHPMSDPMLITKRTDFPGHYSVLH